VSTITETRPSDFLEDLARSHNSGICVCAQVRACCRLLPAEQFPLAWLDFCTAARDRDDVAPPAARDWRDVLGEDAATTQEQAYELLCQRADEALLVLMTGIRA
jgi:hypothetical protein